MWMSRLFPLGKLGIMDQYIAVLGQLQHILVESTKRVPNIGCVDHRVVTMFDAENQSTARMKGAARLDRDIVPDDDCLLIIEPP